MLAVVCCCCFGATGDGECSWGLVTLCVVFVCFSCVIRHRTRGCDSFSKPSPKLTQPNEPNPTKQSKKPKAKKTKKTRPKRLCGERQPIPTPNSFRSFFFFSQKKERKRIPFATPFFFGLFFRPCSRAVGSSPPHRTKCRDKQNCIDVTSSTKEGE